MCGITGKLNFNQQPVTEKEIKTMTNALSHRGPNDEGCFVDGQIGLGHKRLSIIDLSERGHQPMSDEEGRYWITYNGEIYNFPELKKQIERRGYKYKFKSNTDTEVLLRLYMTNGPGCLKYLRGMFAFAVWDRHKKELFLARDRVGQKPLKYYYDNNTFIFASELKAILANPAVKKEPDYPAIDEFLTYKYVPGPKTGFKNIHKLLPAHYLIINKNGQQTMNKYWGLDYTEKLELPEELWEKKIIAKLTEAIQLRLISDVPLGAHLSGGVDSSLIVALMSKELGRKVKTFSVGFTEGYSELPYAKMVADTYNTDHQEFMVEPNAVDILPQLVYHYEEPYADASALPSWYLSEITKQEVTVALNGDGGDENFAGYERYNAMKLQQLLTRIPGKSLFKLTARVLYQLTRSKNFYDSYRLLKIYDRDPYQCYLNIIAYFSQKDKDHIYTDHFKQLSADSDWYEASKKYFDHSQRLGWLDQLLYTGLNTHLPDDLLVKVDIASMAHGLEVRSPFLDHRFLELTAQMPSHLKIAGHNKKYLLKKIAAKYIPKKCVYRRKQGFTVPLDYWFRGRLNQYIRDNLLDPKFLAYGFNKNGIAKMIHHHKTRKQNCENQLWALLMLRLWFKQWFE